jgi:SAM-dependent methyltransferase
MTEPTSAHWSDYWACGYVTSLPQDFSGNYDGEISAFWEGRFADLPAAAQMLDVCTGNGAVALLAAAWSKASQANLAITALDAAELDPGAFLARHPGASALVSTVRFVGGTPLETCTLPEAGFDLVTSQYGIEYCALDAAAAQVARLLKPGGRFAMLAHAADSAMVAVMSAEEKEYDFLEQAGLPRALRDYLEGLADWASLLGVSRSVSEQLRSQPDSALYDSVLGLLDSLLQLDGPPSGETRIRLERSHQHLQYARERLEDMLRVNRMMLADPGWCRVFERHGLVLRASGEILYQGRHPSGQFHCFDKPAQEAD